MSVIREKLDGPTRNTVVKDITPDYELEQFPFTFVLREGRDSPITFRLHLGPIESTLPAAVTSQTVLTAFHVKENPNSSPEAIDRLST